SCEYRWRTASWPQSEELWAIPARARYRAGHCGEAPEDPTVPGESAFDDFEGDFFPLPLAPQCGADAEILTFSHHGTRCAQCFPHCWIEPSLRFCLDPPGEHKPKQLHDPNPRP